MSPRPHRLSPAELSSSFPDVPSPDPVAEVARLFALNLRAAIGGRSGRDIARLSGVDRTSVGAILSGTTWPDMVTVIRLELTLGDLWPRVENTSE